MNCVPYDIRIRIEKIYITLLKKHLNDLLLKNKLMHILFLKIIAFIMSVTKIIHKIYSFREINLKIDKNQCKYYIYIIEKRK